MSIFPINSSSTKKKSRVSFKLDELSKLDTQDLQKVTNLSTDASVKCSLKVVNLPKKVESNKKSTKRSKKPTKRRQKNKINNKNTQSIRYSLDNQSSKETIFTNAERTKSVELDFNLEGKYEILKNMKENTKPKYFCPLEIIRSYSRTSQSRQRKTYNSYDESPNFSETERVKLKNLHKQDVTSEFKPLIQTNSNSSSSIEPNIHMKKSDLLVGTLKTHKFDGPVSDKCMIDNTKRKNLRQELQNIIITNTVIEDSDKSEDEDIPSSQ